MSKKIILLGCMIVFLQACSSSVKKSEPNVTSSPSGAIVSANGLKIGVTPLSTNLYKAFPTGWTDWKLSAQGVLTIKKTGCEDFTLKVDDAVLGKPIHARLKCSGKPVVIKTVPVQKPVTPVKHMPMKKMSKIERRLKELSHLFKSGVITKEEYKKTRVRILNEL